VICFFGTAAWIRYLFLPNPCCPEILLTTTTRKPSGYIILGYSIRRMTFVAFWNKKGFIESYVASRHAWIHNSERNCCFSRHTFSFLFSSSSRHITVTWLPSTSGVVSWVYSNKTLRFGVLGVFAVNSGWCFQLIQPSESLLWCFFSWHKSVFLFFCFFTLFTGLPCSQDCLVLYECRVRIKHKTRITETGFWYASFCQHLIFYICAMSYLLSPVLSFF